jgi:hypothetical protein
MPAQNRRAQTQRPPSLTKFGEKGGLAQPKLAPHKSLAGNYTYAVGCARHCRAIRNQYAHCQWGDDATAGLFFTNLNDAAAKPSGFAFEWFHVDVPLLEEQEAFFVHTRRCLWHVESEYLVLSGQRNKRGHPHKMPRRVTLVNKHNPPEKHPPPWPSKVPSDPS